MRNVAFNLITGEVCIEVRYGVVDVRIRSDLPPVGLSTAVLVLLVALSQHLRHSSDSVGRYKIKTRLDIGLLAALSCSLQSLQSLQSVHFLLRFLEVFSFTGSSVGVAGKYAISAS